MMVVLHSRKKSISAIVCDIESQDVEIAANGSNVVVTWWERNATSNEPVARTSTDNGVTFEPLLKLSANGTIGLE